MKLTNLQNKPQADRCTLDTAYAIHNDLAEKVFYFQIFKDRLTLINVFGTKTLTFVRAPLDVPNSDLQGYFRDVVTKEPVLISNDTIYLC